MGLDEMAGAGNFVMVADPATFRVLPWAQQHRLDAVRHLFPERQAGAVLDAGALSRRAGASLPTPGFDFFAGLEVEFQLFKLIDPKLAPDSLTWPAEAPAVEHTTHGFQYLTESRFDQVDPILAVLRKTMQALGMPLLLARSRAGPEPVRVHLRAGAGTGGRRHHGAVPQRHEAGGAAARLSGRASCAGRDCPTPSPAAGICTSRCWIANRARTCSSPTTRRNCSRRSAGTISPACWRTRARRRRSPRRPSTATSAITASTRWRRSRRSGPGTIAA